MSSNPQRKPALARVREAHPAVTAASAANGGPQADRPARKRATSAPVQAAPVAAPPAPSEGTVQLNVRVPARLRARAELGSLALGAQQGRRVSLQEVVTTAIAEYLDARGL